MRIVDEISNRIIRISSGRTILASLIGFLVTTILIIGWLGCQHDQRPL